MMSNSDIATLLGRHPEVERIEAFVTDVNAISRGKWLPRDKAALIGGKGLPMPRSIFALDIWGSDVEAAGLAFGTGDPDGLCVEVPGTASLMPWADKPTVQVMLTMKGEGSKPFHAEPRGILKAMTERLADQGWRAVIAIELEFYLTEPDVPHPVPPCTGGKRWADGHAQVLSLDALRRHEALFDDIEAACRIQAVPAETMLRENGPGQYEINLRHVADPVAAADHAILLKRIVRHVARRHGLRATFMAKPYGDRSGSGMHVHCSLLDKDGVPAFADVIGQCTPSLHHAVAGLVDTMPQVMLVLAPHANSYRRFRANAHAPVRADWGVDDRAAAVRLITGDRNATRVEQRVAGADANPYLVVSAIIAGIGYGLERGRTPESVGDLPVEWGVAIEAFARSEFVADWFGEQFRDLFVACKRQDFDGMLARVSDVELYACLDLI